MSNSSSSAGAGKPADYVYFDRTTAGLSDDAVPRAKGAQMKLEHYYKVVVDAAIERNTRSVGFLLATRIIRLGSPLLGVMLPDVLSSNDGCRQMI